MKLLKKMLFGCSAASPSGDDEQENPEQGYCG